MRDAARMHVNEWMLCLRFTEMNLEPNDDVEWLRVHTITYKPTEVRPSLNCYTLKSASVICLASVDFSYFLVSTCLRLSAIVSRALSLTYYCFCIVFMRYFLTTLNLMAPFAFKIWWTRITGMISSSYMHRNSKASWRYRSVCNSQKYSSASSQTSSLTVSCTNASS